MSKQVIVKIKQDDGFLSPSYVINVPEGTDIRVLQGQLNQEVKENLLAQGVFTNQLEKVWVYVEEVSYVPVNQSLISVLTADMDLVKD